ncbi:MAG TPA: HAMP domain-containing sensor histidine kinase [Solirubrobacteraceae bacterium]|nr:HAMP domain-containing sensor histidine kinase [Solirubrobacteraceae bacterium]
MSFRRRTVMLAAGAVAAAVVIASVVVYFVTRDELVSQIDASLREKPRTVALAGLSAVEVEKLAKEAGAPPLAQLLSAKGPAPPAAAYGVQLVNGVVVRREMSVTSPAPRRVKPGGGGHASGGVSAPAENRTVGAPKGFVIEQHGVSSLPPSVAKRLPQFSSGARLEIPPQALGGATGYVQLYSPGGTVHTGENGPLLPVTAATRAVAAGSHAAFYGNVTVRGTPVRMFTEQAGKNAVWQAALPLTDLNSTLSNLRLVLALVCLGGIALAGGLGLLVSRAALRPVQRLTGAAEEVARTQDLGHRIEGPGEDELGRLARSFNTMLSALENARLAQRQLVSDASHELRTPLTSVRANLDVLADGERLAPQERARVVGAVQAQLAELTVLVGDLVDLSKGEVADIEVEDVRLDLAAAAAVERAGLHAPACSFALDAEPCLVRAAPARLDRAIANLLDNACSWNPPDGPPIEVRVREGELQVRDHGPGISVEDMPRVFDRFYRAAAARSLPGSGLGLAIVRQVAEMHGGSFGAANDPGGGARLTLSLPGLAMSDAERRAAMPVASGALHDAPRPLSGDSQVPDA